MSEIWKPIKNYEDLYEVSSLGKIKSLPRNTTKGKIITPYKEQNGYLRIIVSKEGVHKRLLIHRIVAEAFISNPDNLPQVNHKDEDKTNNSIDNLEFCTAKYNSLYGTKALRIAQKLNKPIEAFIKNGVILTFNSLTEAEQNGFQHSCISCCCSGKRKTHKGYSWRYKE